MPSRKRKLICVVVAAVVVLIAGLRVYANQKCPIQGCTAVGQEVAIPVHLQDGQEFTLSIPDLISFGQALFIAQWTDQEGQGRPLSKGTGNPISDPTSPLVFPRNFNRISAPETYSCSGCHNSPSAGGGGDIVGNVFVLGQRFDFATFDATDTIPTRGGVDELGNPVHLQNIANSRKTVGMFGSGYLENVAVEMTTDLQSQRNACGLGMSCPLSSKGVSFGTITHNSDDTWNTSAVTGMVAGSLSSSAGVPPSLIIRPYHQASNVISIRQFTNNAYNHHHGMQAEERFGIGIDADGDGFTNELTRADVTAAAVFQATLAAPGRLIPNGGGKRKAIQAGEALFAQVGCTSCHIPALPLNNKIYVEPNPFNPPGNLQQGQGVANLNVDLTDKVNLPLPRLQPDQTGVIMVPAYTDLKVHDITTGVPGDPDHEALDMNQPAGSTGFFAGNNRFITRKLWGIANANKFGHHGQYTTMRDSILAHAGEALSTRTSFQALSQEQQNDVIEFLKSLQVLPAGTKCLEIDDNGTCIHVPGILP
jgi:cytochrome c peroxidase